jgi:hypothetical protein
MLATAQIAGRISGTARGCVLDARLVAFAHGVMAKESFDKKLRGRWRSCGSAILRT